MNSEYYHFKCSVCGKSYVHWRPCARHASRKHDGHALVVEIGASRAKLEKFLEEALRGL